MTDNKALADAVVALGIGGKDPHEVTAAIYRVPESVQWLTAKDFVRDAGVAMALMEWWLKGGNRLDIDYCYSGFHCCADAADPPRCAANVIGDDLNRTIVASCVQALREGVES